MFRTPSKGIQSQRFKRQLGKTYHRPKLLELFFSHVPHFSLHLALWCHGDSIVTWGDSRSGGDSSTVRNQLRGVQQIQAFAAILADGSVVTWGGAHHGGDSSRSAQASIQLRWTLWLRCPDWLKMLRQMILAS